MKWSKLDPMTLLMLVVAVGVVITMLTQNSVASVDRVSLERGVAEKSVSTERKGTEGHAKDIKGKSLHISYNSPAITKK